MAEQSFIMQVFMNGNFAKLISDIKNMDNPAVKAAKFSFFIFDELNP